MATATTRPPGLRAVRIGDAITLSDKYVAMLPLAQMDGSGVPRDISGNGANMVLGPLLTEAESWSVPNYLTTQAGTGGGGANNAYAYIPYASMAMEVSAIRSLIVSVTFNRVPDGTWFTMGNSDGGQPGFYVVTDAGVTYVNMYDGTGGGASQSTLTLVSDMDVSADVTLTLAFDGPTKTIAAYVNGVLDATAVGVTHFYWEQDPANGFALGGGMHLFGSSYAAAFSALHVLQFDGGLPTNIGSIAARLGLNPKSPLSSAEV